MSDELVVIKKTTTAVEPVRITEENLPELIALGAQAKWGRRARVIPTHVEISCEHRVIPMHSAFGVTHYAAGQERWTIHMDGIIVFE